MLGADAVIGLRPRRTVAREEDGDARRIEYTFTGTAARVATMQRAADAPPVLTLASAQELWLLLRAGVEPIGVAGSFASVHTSVSFSSRRITVGAGRFVGNAELEDLTKSAYEARRLALDRLRDDAGGLGATGVIGVDMEHQHHTGGTLAGAEITIHLLATAIRRGRRSGLAAETVVRLGSAVDA
jgi:uncharacterized protein YbjQ (UPF0145 family)